ncbi:MAG: SDR family NAD(P)-dependent oxidoreductase [Balneolaceae bacterium]
MNRLIDKWVLITGATSGIGKASSKLFAQHQSKLIITGRRGERLKNLREELQKEYGIQILTFCFDVRDRDACKRCVDSIKQPIDVLLNNAGLASGKDAINDADFSDWDAMIDTNINGLLSMTRFVSKRMKKRNAGHIINVGSIAGYESYPGGSVYCATKHAVKAITQSAKMDLTGTNIRVSSVSPGLVETEFSKVRFHGDEDKASGVYKNIEPLKDVDIAEIIFFMANRPPHVNILDTIVFPVAQSSATLVSR